MLAGFYFKSCCVLFILLLELKVKSCGCYLSAGFNLNTAADLLLLLGNLLVANIWWLIEIRPRALKSNSSIWM